MKKVIKERVSKRIFDIMMSIIILGFFSPFTLLVAILLKLEGFLNPGFRGPVFFREIRISKGRPFKMYKFRTVKSDVLKLLRESGGKRSITEFTSSPDKGKYLTPVGRILAQIYFDEFPQLFNVVRGDISLVGPRPHIPEHYENDLKTGLVSAKYIKAGLMGLGQASKGNPQMREVFKRMAKKYTSENKSFLFIDRLYFQKYLRAHTVEMMLFDVWIMLRCILVVIQAKGL